MDFPSNRSHKTKKVGRLCSPSIRLDRPRCRHPWAWSLGTTFCTTLRSCPAHHSSSQCSILLAGRAAPYVPRRRARQSREFDLSKRWIASEVTCIGSYTLGKTLGEGKWSLGAMVGTHILTGQEVAIKIVDKIHAPLVAREIETWRHLHHPNIAQLYEVIVSDDKIYMATELCRGGEIFDYVCEHGRLRDDSPETKRIFRQIVEAVGYCHEKNFVHRDLKLENILLTSDLQVKVIDFGFTKQYSDRKLLDTYCGSVAYAAPEMISGKKYSGPQADVWSLGVILYTLVCGYLPFDDNNDLMVHKKIVELDYELPEWLSEESTDLIKKILQLDGLSRLSIIDILKHPWLSSE
ncbi:kinase-like domain-containing protein, partial [Polychytrium aggregatum]|uniref:kinase-like domain-containing protein n=1 Tax=Polychytrium aggregatum TaxID=110093 RepID=UPI0022FF3C3F